MILKKKSEKPDIQKNKIEKILLEQSDYLALSHHPEKEEEAWDA